MDISRLCISAKRLLKPLTPFQRELKAYRRLLDTVPVDDSTVLLDQENGLTLDGNVYYLLKELLGNAQYPVSRIVFTTQPANDKAFSSELTRRGLSVETAVRNSPSYLHALATAKYLMVDNGLPTYFVKRSGQVVLNTWHGVPLKTLGRHQRSGAHQIGNVQRNLALADYLVFPNAYTEEHLVDGYMVSGISTGVVLPTGYPRNTPFLKEREPRSQHAYAWLPTFRQSKRDPRALPCNIIDHLTELDSLLTDDEVLYFKAHPASTATLDLDAYKHIKPYPTNVEAYETLADCDALITDYSSVLYDFPLGGGKVILWPLDEQAYSEERGLYEPLDGLPFPKVSSAKELIDELRSSKQYDLSAFLRKTWPTQGIDDTKRICERIVLDGSSIPGEHATKQPDLPTLLVYTEFDCNLDDLFHTLSELSCTNAVRLAFPAPLAADKDAFLYSLPSTVTFMPLQEAYAPSASQLWAIRRVLRGSSTPAAIKAANDLCSFIKSCSFPNMSFDQVVIHDGKYDLWLLVVSSLQS